MGRRTYRVHGVRRPWWGWPGRSYPLRIWALIATRDGVRAAGIRPLHAGMAPPRAPPPSVSPFPFSSILLAVEHKGRVPARVPVLHCRPSTCSSLVAFWVAEEYRLVPDTLYLTVNCIDRYLSGNEINRQRLQLLGVACFGYGSFCPELPEDPALQLEFLANFVAGLSLLEYNLLSYPPSLVAASAIFLAKFILAHEFLANFVAWNSTLAHYTQHKSSELSDCKGIACRLYSVGPGSNLPAIREKYSQHKYKFVAKKSCPSSVPAKFFAMQRAD
uniref:Cyclin C-terminal domain-containing protein n=1 Tax=Leersia perrieri TaxID=77586 RepID=A0A0D9XU50_9ORYZ